MTPPRWFRVYAHGGMRLVVRALDEYDAKNRARMRWGRAGLYTCNHEAREMTDAEVAEHLASMAAFEAMQRGHEVLARSSYSEARMRRRLG